MQAKSKDIKFLERVKEFALRHHDQTVPYDRADLMQTKMYFLGVIDALYAEGFEVVKKEKKP